MIECRFELPQDFVDCPRSNLMPFIGRKYFSGLFRTLAALFSILAAASASFPVTGDESPTLSKCWEYKVDTSDHGALASDDQFVFIGTEDGSVQALDAATSQVIWKSELGGRVASDLFDLRGNLYVVSGISGPDKAEAATLRSLSTTSGVPSWSRPISPADHVYLGYTGGSLLAIANDGTLTAVSEKTGNVVWTSRLGEPVSASPIYLQNKAVIATKSHQVKVISSDNGSVQKHFQTNFTPTAIAGDENFLFVGDERGNTSKIRTDSGKVVWNYKSGGAISRLAVTENGLLASSLDNFIYMISPDSGHVVWKRRMPGRVVEGGVILDKYVFALVYGEGTGFLIDPANGKPIGRIERDYQPADDHLPVPVGDWNVLFSAANGIALYSLKHCGKN